MRAAAQAFVGFRDFRYFAESDGEDDATGPPRSTDVKVDRVDVIESGDLMLIVVEGSHFLWKMVRRMVGVLVEVGRGRIEPGAASRYLREESGAPARLTAPPSGLFLARVFYAARTARRRGRGGHADRETASVSLKQPEAERQPKHFVVTPRPGLDAVRLQIRIVHAPAGGRNRAG